MSLRWYFHRLKSMGLRELVWRLRAAVRKTIDGRRRFEWAQFASDGECPRLPCVEAALRRGADAAFIDASRSYLDEFLGGALRLIGQDWPKRRPDALFPVELWSLDPATGGYWPGREAFCFSIDYREARGRGDIKFVWELNRLQFLPLLACGVALRDDARALAAIETAIESWMAANPPFRGVAWNSGIELAIRAVSLNLCASLCADRLSPSSIGRLRATLAAHLYWLRRYPSRFSSANNHLIYEALGVFVICRAMPGADPDGSIAADAREVLDREAALQFYSDGMSAEQCVSYGAFAAEALLLAALIQKHSGERAASPPDDRLAAFADCIDWLCDAKGRTPAIGDDDNGCAIASFAEEGTTYATSVARCAAALLGRPSAAPPPVRPTLREALFCPAPRAAPPPAGVKTFAHGGYTIVRERRRGRHLLFVLDHGPLGYLSIAAHGHADALAIFLALDDQPLLMDAGAYLYHSGGAWRDWFRGTRAHNTLTLGGEDQSRISGPFNWSHKAQAWLESASVDENWRLTARQDGYAGRFKVIHERVAFALADGVAIEDRLLPAGSPEWAEAVFQFAPVVSLSGEGLERSIAIDDETVGRICFSLPGSVTLRCGEPCLAGGWVSESFGRKTAAPQLVWRGRLGAEPLTTCILWTPRRA